MKTLFGINWCFLEYNWCEMIRINPFPRSGLSSGLLSECLISSSAPQMFTTLRVIQLNIELRTGRQTNKQTVERPVSIASSHGLSKATVIMMEFVPYYALQLFMSINSLRFFSSEIAFEDDILYFILHEIPYVSYVASTSLYQTDNTYISFRTYIWVKMAVIGRPQEKRSSVSALQGSAWSGSYPREWTPTSYKVYSILWNWYIYCYFISHRCL